VEARDAVGEAGHSDGEHSHGEGFGLIGDIFASEGEEAFEVEAEGVVEVLEIMRDEGGRETVDAGGDGSVSGEDVPGGGSLARLIEGEGVSEAEQASAFEGQEGGMAFVHVADGGFDTECGERADASDTEDDFLADAHVMVAEIETAGDVAVVVGVFGEVGIEEIEGDTPDV